MWDVDELGTESAESTVASPEWRGRFGFSGDPLDPLAPSDVGDDVPDDVPIECQDAGVTAFIDCAQVGIELNPDLAADYECYDLGVVPGLPGLVAGVLQVPGDPHALIIGGNGGGAGAKLYQVAITRDAACHVTGFGDSVTVLAHAPGLNGGMTWGPNGSILYSRWPLSQVGIIAAGSTETDKVLHLGGEIGMSLSGLTVVPPSSPGAGQIKLGLWPSSHYFTADVVDDGNGLFDIVAVTSVQQLSGGAEGLTYAPAGSPNLPGGALLVAESFQRRVSSYDVDANGDPIVSSRKDVISNVNGPHSAHLDPLSGDMLTTTALGSHLIAVRGFAAPPQ